MKLFLLSICWLCALSVSPSSCGGISAVPDRAPQARSDAAQAMGYTGFIDRLRAVGLRVQRNGEVEQPFLSITGTMIKVQDEDVQVFEYSTPKEMEAQAALISRDGSTVGTTKIHWIGAPHFYKEGRLLVLYLGDSDKVRKSLEAVLGRQFAGQ